jgi:putative membrane protein
MRVVKFLFICHLVALICGLGGLLIVAPHPAWWSIDPIGVTLFEFLLRNFGALHVLFGAATMFVFGLLCVGSRKTFIFFASSMLITLSMELFGTSIGFPLGFSSSATLPGVEVAGIDPYSILLTWFYMGFTSYLVAGLLTVRLKIHQQTLWSLVLGTYFLITWDLALNAAMTNGHGSPQVLLWQDYGTYFGMPMRNPLGWALNSLIFLSLIRLIWRSNFDSRRLANWLPLGVYSANTGFVMALNLSIGLWFPTLLSALFVLFPASLILIPGEETRSTRMGRARIAFCQVIWLVMYTGSLVIARWKLQVDVEGRENVPSSGPVLIAVRHFHWFYDGCILVSTIPRRLHTIIALDWMQSRISRYLVELSCSLADWPVILRSEQFLEHEENKQWAFTPIETRYYLRQVTAASVRLFRSGEIIVIFPEGYPNIDPHPTPKTDLEEFLPFRPGFIKFIEQAERDDKTRVAIVPAGLSYSRTRGKRWQATVRYGPALFRSDFDNAEQLLHAVEEDVHALSNPAPPALPSP